MKRLRTFIFWTHLVVGLAAGLVILAMSVTGVLLTYEKQLIAWADTRAYQVAAPPAGSRRLTIDELLERVRAQGHEPVSILLRSTLTRPAEVTTTRSGVRMIDLYTGNDLGAPLAGVRTFFRTVTNWHRWLGATTPGTGRTIGRAVTGAANLGFLFLVVSGFYLWFPRGWTWPKFRSVLWFRRGLRAKARDFNWHNVIGFWSAIPLALIVFSGAVISYPWASNLVYQLAGETPPSPGRGAVARANRGNLGPAAAELKPAAPFEELWQRAEAHMPSARSISMRYPESNTAPIVFTLDGGSGGQPQSRATLMFNPDSGEVVRWEPFSSLSRGRQARSILRFAHTGEVAGLAGQTVAGVVSLGGAVLVWTGVAMAWRRLFAKKQTGAAITRESRAA